MLNCFLNGEYGYQRCQFKFWANENDMFRIHSEIIFMTASVDFSSYQANEPQYYFDFSIIWAIEVYENNILIA